MSRAILITGASRGIGAATARLCGAQGWRVGVNYRAQADAAAEVGEAVTAAGGEAAAIPGDVAREADVEAMFDQAEAAFGPLDGVVVNAGAIGPRMALAEMEPQRIRRIIEINVVGALLTARTAARRMSSSRGGRGGSIVVVSSTAARLGAPNEFVDYAASKGAADALTLGLSKELAGEGVRVNAVRPGLIETEIHADAGWADRAQDMGAQTPLGRAGRPEEVAEAIVWLLSDKTSYVTGALIDVAGGR